MKKYVPTFLADSIFEINIEFYIKHNIKYMFIDLDNTLDGPKIPIPSVKTINLINNLKKNNITPIVFSNNSKKRVKKYCSVLKCEYVSRAFKPFIFKIKKYCILKNIDKKSSIIIGDQVMTDIFCANNLGIKSILTNRLTTKDQIITILNRKIDEHYRKKIIKNKLSKKWGENYV